jgi:hypothetical protein
MSPEARQFELGKTPITAEQELQVERLQHGIAMLDLFDREVTEEDRRNDFLKRTSPGSESRAEILAGNAYNGDATKLSIAINKVRKKFAIRGVQRQAMLEAAGFLGIPATFEGEQVITTDPAEQTRLSSEYGRYRVRYASRQRTEERGLFREHLKSKVEAITGEPIDVQTEAEDDEAFPSVDIEERAVRLTRAINIMAWRSMLSGLNVAIPDPNYSEPIYERYVEQTTEVDRHASNKSRRIYEKAKSDFWVGSGFAEIRKGGIMSEYLLKRKSQKMWREFAGQFEHSPQQKQRVKTRKQLKKFIPEDRLPETKDFHGRV